MTELTDLAAIPLPDGVRSRIVANNNGLDMHFLEGGFDSGDWPTIILLHGFPELAYSWRKIIPKLAGAGYHVIAPDLRGYGRTTGWVNAYVSELTSFHMTDLVKDIIGLIAALDIPKVHGIVGHDFGSSVASTAALFRPDLFKSMILMSAPFEGVPSFPVGTAKNNTNAEVKSDIHADLASLDRPKKHYQWYYSTPEANDDIMNCAQGLRDFLRAYYHHKSADWSGNDPYPLTSWSAEELAKLPTYYVMDLDKDMAETVAEEMPTEAEIANCTWLTENELSFYVGEYSRTGFQGGLNWYRCRTGGQSADDLRLFSGRTVDVPSCFITGKSDWGNYQKPGAIEAMQGTACTDFRGVHFVDGAGHWVQQEQPDEVARLMLEFFAQTR